MLTVKETTRCSLAWDSIQFDAGCDVSRIQNLDGLPFNRRKLPRDARLACFVLSVAARQANRSNRTYVTLF